jgi:hypothetical protein
MMHKNTLTSLIIGFLKVWYLLFVNANVLQLAQEKCRAYNPASIKQDILLSVIRLVPARLPEW